jgi:hypothetical protein
MNITTTALRFASLSAAAVAAFFVTACSEHGSDPHDHAEHDVVTTIELELTASDTTMGKQVITWEDLDGPGGANPTRIDTVVLRPGISYAGRVRVMNRSVSPVEDLTPTIEAERDNHQFFYQLSDGLGTLTITDKDSRQLPVGLAFALSQSGSAPAGTMSVQLSHFDNATSKNGTTPSDETDVSVVFPVVVR